MATKQKVQRRRRYRLRYRTKRKQKRKMEFDSKEAAKGSAAGATIDVALGGTSLGLGSVIGGALAGFGVFEGAKGNRNDGTKWIPIDKYIKGGSRFLQPVVLEDTNPNWYKKYKGEIEADKQGLYTYETMMSLLMQADQLDRSILNTNLNGLAYWQYVEAEIAKRTRVDQGFYKPSPPATGNTGSTFAGMLSDIVGGAKSGAIAGAIGGALSNPTIGSAVNDTINKQAKTAFGKWFADNWYFPLIALPLVFYGIYKIFNRR